MQRSQSLYVQKNVVIVVVEDEIMMNNELKTLVTEHFIEVSMLRKEIIALRLQRKHSSDIEERNILLERMKEKETIIKKLDYELLKNFSSDQEFEELYDEVVNEISPSFTNL